MNFWTGIVTASTYKNYKKFEGGEIKPNIPTNEMTITTKSQTGGKLEDLA